MDIYVIGTAVVVLLVIFVGGIAIARADPLRKFKNSTPQISYLPVSEVAKYRTYSHELTRIIEDISKKAKSIKDDEVRAYWTEYVQELRIRQLKVLQEIHDKEYRDLQQGDFKHLSDSDIRSKDAQVQRGINWAANRSL